MAGRRGLQRAGGTSGISLSLSLSLSLGLGLSLSLSIVSNPQPLQPPQGAAAAHVCVAEQRQLPLAVGGHLGGQAAGWRRSCP